MLKSARDVRTACEWQNDVNHTRLDSNSVGDEGCYQRDGGTPMEDGVAFADLAGSNAEDAPKKIVRVGKCECGAGNGRRPRRNFD